MCGWEVDCNLNKLATWKGPCRGPGLELKGLSYCLEKANSFTCCFV